MRNELSVYLSSFIAIRGEHTSNWLQHDEGMKTAWRFFDRPYDPVLEECFASITGREVQ